MTTARWKSADDLDRRPAALLRLEEALRHLALVAFPSTGSSALEGRSSSSSSHWSASATPDAVRRPARRALKRILADVDRLADRALALAEGRDVPRPRGFRCETCGAGQRPQAKLCDQCGAPRPA